MERCTSESEGCGKHDITADWVAGFVDGVCFFIGIQKNPTVKIGFQVISEFRVVQHQRDLDVLYTLKQFFGFGRVCRNRADRWEYRVRRLRDVSRIISFFKQYPLRTKKHNDAQKFGDVLRMMEEGRHLTTEGLRDIKRIAVTMNTGNRPRLVTLLDEDRAL
jgi:hypothetical protein